MRHLRPITSCTYRHSPFLWCFGEGQTHSHLLELSLLLSRRFNTPARLFMLVNVEGCFFPSTVSHSLSMHLLLLALTNQHQGQVVHAGQCGGPATLYLFSSWNALTGNSTDQWPSLRSRSPTTVTAFRLHKMRQQACQVRQIWTSWHHINQEPQDRDAQLRLIIKREAVASPCMN